LSHRGKHSATPGIDPVTASVKPNNQPPPGPIGNATGMIVPDTAPNPHGSSQPTIKATTEEAGWWQRWGSDALHLGLDVVGLIPVVGEVADGANALLYLAEGDKINAALSAAAMVPGAGMAATGAKLGKKAVGAVAEGAAKATREGVEKAAKKEAAEETSEQAAKKSGGNGGGKDKGKGKLKCGKSGKYGDLKKQTGDGKFDRDHIPSKAALKARAEALLGRSLKPGEAKAIENAGDAIAIPRQAHQQVSPTYGQTPAQAAKDAQDLAGSAKRDVNAMLDKIEEYDADGGCKEAYKQAASSILKKTNDDFDDLLLDVIEKAMK